MASDEGQGLSDKLALAEMEIDDLRASKSRLEAENARLTQVAEDLRRQLGEAQDALANVPPDMQEAAKEIARAKAEASQSKQLLREVRATSDRLAKQLASASSADGD